jgi:hypothetical protein
MNASSPGFVTRSAKPSNERLKIDVPVHIVRVRGSARKRATYASEQNAEYSRRFGAVASWHRFC